MLVNNLAVPGDNHTSDRLELARLNSFFHLCEARASETFLLRIGDYPAIVCGLRQCGNRDQHERNEPVRKPSLFHSPIVHPGRTWCLAKMKPTRQRGE